MTRRSIVGSIKNRRSIGKSSAQSITLLFVLSTIFGAMFLGSAQPATLPQHKHTTRPKKESELAEAIHDLWHSIFDWSFLMLIITPKPKVRTINEHRQRQSVPDSNGTSFRFSRFFAGVRSLFSGMVNGAFAVLRSPFTSESKSQSSPLPHYVPPSSRADNSFGQTITSSTTINPSTISDKTIQTPGRAVTPTHRTPKSDIPEPSKSSPTTTKFLATLTDLEAQTNNHQFYDLERELADMDNQMAQMFDFSWMPRKAPAPNSPESPIPVTIPQAPPPARRDGKTIQILPMICEVSEHSPDLAHTPPYDARWSIVTFQPLWGPRAQVGAAY